MEPAVGAGNHARSGYQRRAVAGEVKLPRIVAGCLLGEAHSARAPDNCTAAVGFGAEATSCRVYIHMVNPPYIKLSKRDHTLEE